MRTKIGLGGAPPAAVEEAPWTPAHLALADDLAADEDMEADNALGDGGGGGGGGGGGYDYDAQNTALLHANAIAAQFLHSRASCALRKYVETLDYGPEAHVRAQNLGDLASALATGDPCVVTEVCVCVWELACARV